MFRPTLVTPPTALPVSLEDVKAALRVDGTDFDAEIERLIKSAVAHYEGWSGVLGIALVEQTWRQEYGRFEGKMGLSLRPVRTVASVKYLNEAGQSTTVATDQYQLRQDGGGRSYVQFIDGYSPPDVHPDGFVTIEFVVGWPVAEGKATTPEDIQTAIILRVQKHFDEAAQANSDILDRVERELVSKYRTPLI
jgi:uncharacterized phiE125 gp8 family phage protein